MKKGEKEESAPESSRLARVERTIHSILEPNDPDLLVSNQSPQAAQQVKDGLEVNRLSRAIQEPGHVAIIRLQHLFNSSFR